MPGFVIKDFKNVGFINRLVMLTLHLPVLTVASICDAQVIYKLKWHVLYLLRHCLMELTWPWHCYVTGYGLEPLSLLPLCPECWDYRCTSLHKFMWQWRSYPGPCACWANTLPTELQPQPSIVWANSLFTCNIWCGSPLCMLRIYFITIY